MCRIAQSANSKIYFYQILCDHDELFNRARSKTRTKYKKVRSPKVLREILNKYDLYTPIPGVKNLTVDTTKLSAARAAKIILDDINAK